MCTSSRANGTAEPQRSPIVIIGFGSIAKGALPLILRHIRAPRGNMVVISPDDSSRRLAELEGVRFEKLAPMSS